MGVPAVLATERLVLPSTRSMPEPLPIRRELAVNGIPSMGGIPVLCESSISTVFSRKAAPSAWAELNSVLRTVRPLVGLS